MEPTTRKEKGSVIVSVKGRIDAVTCSDIEKYLSEAVAGDEKFLVLNLNEVDYISSAGLRSILVIARKLKAQQGEFVLAGLQQQVKRVIEMSGFGSFLRIFDTEEDALEQI